MLLCVYFSVQIVKMNPQSACDVPTFTVLLQKKASTGLYSVFIQFSNTSTTYKSIQHPFEQKPLSDMSIW